MAVEQGTILYGDGDHNDLPTIRRLFLGHPAFDVRIQQMIMAPNLNSLPPGTYRLVDPPQTKNQ